MPQELKTLTINLKSLDQDIPDPITVGGANANGRTFRIIFDQEAAAQMTDDTVVYLRWKHQQKNIQGYNNFTKVSDDPIVWELKWPCSMMNCGAGEVTCDIELVDDISISPTQTFLVHILSEPHDGSNYIVSDDFDVFQEAVITMTTLAGQIEDQMKHQSQDFSEMKEEFTNIKTESEEVLKKAKDVVDDIQVRLDEKLDVNRVGIDFTDDIPDIKTYVDEHITEPHLTIKEFVGEDE